MFHTTSKARLGIKHGYRSGLEEQVSHQIAAAGLAVAYETLRIEYEKPSKKSKYTPDFNLPNGIIVETKGRFLTDDRQKHLLVKAQHPHLDIRFVFSNSKARISKVSPTTYALWCDKHGFQYADRRIPDAWLTEKKKS